MAREPEDLNRIGPRTRVGPQFAASSRNGTAADDASKGAPK